MKDRPGEFDKLKSQVQSSPSELPIWLGDLTSSNPNQRYPCQIPAATPTLKLEFLMEEKTWLKTK